MFPKLMFLAICGINLHQFVFQVLVPSTLSKKKYVYNICTVHTVSHRHLTLSPISWELRSSWLQQQRQDTVKDRFVCFTCLTCAFRFEDLLHSSPKKSSARLWGMSESGGPNWNHQDHSSYHMTSLNTVAIHQM